MLTHRFEPSMHKTGFSEGPLFLFLRDHSLEEVVAVSAHSSELHWSRLMQRIHVLVEEEDSFACSSWEEPLSCHKREEDACYTKYVRLRTKGPRSSQNLRVYITRSAAGLP
jgi:hypothetical protein